MTAIGGSAPVIDLTEITFGWPGERFSLSVRAFSIPAGQTVLLLGESGSGKSTLLSLICGIALPRTGRVSVMGQDLSKLSARRRDRFRADKLGIIFQMFNLLPYASALDNVRVPLRFSRERRNKCRDERAAALALTSALGLPEALVAHGPASSLSVGQQQRVAVARALIGGPPIVIADEPTSSLDAGAQAGFLDLVFGQIREAGATLLMVSHDERLACRFDRVVHLNDIAVQRRVPA